MGAYSVRATAAFSDKVPALKKNCVSMRERETVTNQTNVMLSVSAIRKK